MFRYFMQRVQNKFGRYALNVNLSKINYDFPKILVSVFIHVVSLLLLHTYDTIITNMKTVLNKFLVYLEVERGRSLRTVVNYRHYVEEFFARERIGNPAAITQETVRRFRLALNARGLKRRTQNYYLIALRQFLRWCVKNGTRSLAPEKIELAKVGERDIDIPDIDDVERLLNAPLKDSDSLFFRGLTQPNPLLLRPPMSIGGLAKRGWAPTPTKKKRNPNPLRIFRDKAILELLFSTGLRVSELVALNRDSLDLSRDEFSVRGKGEKVRLVFLSPNAKTAIKMYLTKRGDIEEALFINTKKEPARLTPRQIQRLIRFYAAKAGIAKKVTPHTLRHFFATDLLINGADLRSVQALLGHSSISTTQVYTHLTDKTLREVHSTFHAIRRH